MSNLKDITGNVYGRLTAIKRLGKSKNGDYLWYCECSCGGTAEVPIGRLNYGRTTSCGCKIKEASHKTHGMSGTRTYKLWAKMRSRVRDQDNPKYTCYKHVKYDQDILDSFEAFYEHMGEIPEDKRSLDRIDSSKGYVRGNMRWADDKQQARNRGFHKNNTSGVVGVMKDRKWHCNKTKYTDYYVSVYNDLNCKQRRIYTRIDRYGDELAFLIACEIRLSAIEAMNRMGAGYTPTHGK